ncbi:hypothetical protein WH52_03445 [Tenacibaculum holothuriorum]|uniref:Lipoprotein n=1 Tax=Tenacibaculum holothuriorum TaxID=1635173 RepID=A0A1Y2PE47_9FLAO|nr:hypothetical protein [Tenacibaculum holothuriorum]OSY88742.1 hypothetical protein WH52_03445 [Tenacibaculum holothuriorum]
MLKHFLGYILLVLLLISCGDNNDKKKETVVADRSDMNVTKQYTVPSKLSSISEKEMKKWKEYHQLVDFIKRYEKISPSKALSNVLELKDITKKFKDTIRVNDLKTRAFRARLNVFNNEVLRLADMSYIGVISAKQINEQVAKVNLIYSSINDKVNAVYAKKEFDKTINLDNFFQLDSTKPRKRKTVNPSALKDTKQLQKDSKLELKEMNIP